jgi:CarboxypepD_reg-like domain
MKTITKLSFVGFFLMSISSGFAQKKGSTTTVKNQTQKTISGFNNDKTKKVDSSTQSQVRKVIHGFIVEQSNPLVGVKILVSGSDKVISTDYDGSFSISTVLSSGKITFQFLGYKDVVTNFDIEPKKFKIDFGTMEIQSGKKVVIEEKKQFKKPNLIDMDNQTKGLTNVVKASVESYVYYMD